MTTEAVRICVDSNEDLQDLIGKMLREDPLIQGFCLFSLDNYDLMTLAGGRESLRALRDMAFTIFTSHFGAENVGECPRERGILVGLKGSDREHIQARIHASEKAISEVRLDQGAFSLCLDVHSGVIWRDLQVEEPITHIYHRLIRAALLSRDPWAARFSRATLDYDNQKVDLDLTARLLCDLPAALSDNRLNLTAQAIRPIQTDHDDEDMYEVLLTLQDHDGQSYPPAFFLIAAEDSALIQRVDHWVLRRVLVDYASDLKAKPQIGLSLNVTARTICSPDFLPFLQQCFDEGGIEPRRIQLEITEGSVMHSPVIAEANVAAARALGCRIALDDFGTGQSGYGYLKAFKPDCLKIDGSLVRDITTAQDFDARIVQSITTLAHELGAEIVAEHVSTPQTLSVLRELGVDKVQGFEVGRPLPISQIWM